MDHSLACHSVVSNGRIALIGSSRPQAAVWLAQTAGATCHLTERIYSRMERDKIPHFELLPFKLAASHARTLFRADAGRPKAVPDLVRYPGRRRLRYCWF